MSKLKLTALDTDDLEVISAHMQDAVIIIGDVRFLKPAKKFALIGNRFLGQTKKPPYERRRTGLSFDRVTGAKSHRIRQGADDAVLSLLSISFTPAGAEEPSGTIALTFSGGGQINLEVECIEARLEDLGPAWATPNLPSHGDDAS